MSVTFLSYFLELLPIIIGAAIFLLVKSLKLVEKKIVIDGTIDRRSLVAWTGIKNINLAKVERLPVKYDDLEADAGLFDIFKVDFVAFLNAPAQYRVWNQFVGEVEDLQEGVFKRLEYDTAIINGLAGKSNKKGIKKLLLSKAGMTSIHEIPELVKTLRHEKIGTVRLFVGNFPDFLQKLESFNQESGVLLAYMINHNLELVGETYDADS